MFRSDPQPLYIVVLEAALELAALTIFCAGIAFLALGWERDHG